MYPELIDAKYISDYRIWVKYSDNTEGAIDFEKELYGEIFEPLLDINIFKSFKIHPELKVLTWNNGADFAPEFVYEKLKQAA